MRSSFYKEDLAHIHDTGFGGPALRWVSPLLSLLKRYRITGGLIVDLGCGSGILAKRMSESGYSVLGIDDSAAFIKLARKRSPMALFKRASLFETPIPPCASVVSTGECLNYLFDRRSNQIGLLRLFRRIYSALEPGGLLAFDLADPGQVPTGKGVRNFTQGDDWIVLVDKREDHRKHILTRRIITFRRTGTTWRRGEEVHRQRLYRPEEVVRLLKKAGFQPRLLPQWKNLWLPSGHTAFIARKQ